MDNSHRRAFIIVGIIFVVAVILDVGAVGQSIHEVLFSKGDKMLAAQTLLLFIMVLFLPLLISLKLSWGKGLVLGSIIAALYTGADLYVKFNYTRGCTDACGFENIVLLIVPLVYFAIGLANWNNKTTA